jgi:hypothetical protein
MSSLLLWAFVAAVVLPLALGFWVGHGPFAAVAFLALGVTLLLRQLQLDQGDSSGPAVLGIAGTSLLSAAAAYVGGRLRERRRQPS